MKRLGSCRVLALAVLAAGLASCGEDRAEPPVTTTSVAASVTDVPTSTATTTGFEIPGNLGEALLILPPVDQGVLIEQRWLDYDTASEMWGDPTIASDGLIMTLESCSVRYPGQWAFEITLGAAGAVEFPITLGLELDWGHGDVVTGAPPLEVDVAAAGAFTVVYDQASYLRDHIDLVVALDARDREEMAEQLLSDLRSSGIGWEGAGCSLEVHYSPNAAVADPLTFRSAVVTEDLISPEVTAIEGTVEYLAQTADLTAGPSPGRSWAQLYGHGWMPLTPVVWMEPDRAFSSLSEHWTVGGRCYTIRTEYHFDNLDPYQVWQYQGCASDSPVPGQPSAFLEVGGWTIVAAAEDQVVVDAAIERLRPFFVTNTWPAPSIALGETIAETTFEGAVIYLVSLDYGENGAGIFLESPDIDFSHGPVSGANGESFRGCWQTTVYQDAGIALVLVGDPTWDVRVDGAALDLLEAEGGIGYALIEWTSQQPPIPTITNSQGSTPCS